MSAPEDTAANGRASRSTGGLHAHCHNISLNPKASELGLRGQHQAFIRIIKGLAYILIVDKYPERIEESET